VRAAAARAVDRVLSSLDALALLPFALASAGVFVTDEPEAPTTEQSPALVVA